MAVVLHFSKRLLERPAPGSLPGIALRQFHDDRDIPLWLELRNRAFARAKPGVLGWGATDFAREMLDRPWWSPDRLWFALADSPGADQPLPVGTVALASREIATSSVAVVHWLAVLATHRRQGVARLLMQALEQRAWDLGQRDIFLETHDGWIAAQRLYESLGYQQVPGATKMS
ncbi:MAG TPA: GNAT family N-acetyltransferase [Pirellulales bacterium]